VIAGGIYWNYWRSGGMEDNVLLALGPEG
jgi:hypothetical protein